MSANLHENGAFATNTGARLNFSTKCDMESADTDVSALKIGAIINTSSGGCDSESEAEMFDILKDAGVSNCKTWCGQADQIEWAFAETAKHEPNSWSYSEETAQFEPLQKLAAKLAVIFSRSQEAPAVVGAPALWIEAANPYVK